MAKKKIEVKVESEDQIKDVTELGMDVEGLQELEVTEVEAVLESGEASELIEEASSAEEEACENEISNETGSDQKENEEKDSKSKLENEKKSSSEKKSLTESVTKNVRSVKPSKLKVASTSLVGSKTAKIETEFSQQEVKVKVKSQPEKPKARRVKPQKANVDGTMRSTFGIFHR